MIEEESFEGYTAGDTWNGWACPHFEFEEAMRLVEAFDGYKHPYDGSAYRAIYDEDTNHFAFYSPSNDEWESFGPVEKDGVTLYPIGAYTWTWCEVDE